MSKVLNFIEKLILRTDKNEIIWTMFEKVEQAPKIKDIYEYYTEDAYNIPGASYVTHYKDGTIVLLGLTFENSHKVLKKHDVEHLLLCLQSKPDTKMSELNTLKEYQTELFRLLNMIDRQVNEVDEFIEDFLTDF